MLSYVRRFAALVLHSRKNALSLVSGLALLSFLFPPLFLLASAIVSLVTLRVGLREGFQVLAALVLVMSACLIWIYESAQLLPALLLWSVPVWLLSARLRSSASVWVLLRTALWLIVGLIALLYLLGFDMIQLHKAAVKLGTRPEMLAGATEQYIRLLHLIALPFLIAIFVLLIWIVPVFLGRWLQAMLYNPGGFQHEFHLFRMSWYAAMPFGLALGFALLQSGTLQFFATDVTVLFLAVYWLAGIALIHAIAGMLRLHWGIFFFVYMLNFIWPMPLILAGAGFFDSFFNFRQHFASRE